jgi:hypothetical protein
LFEVVMFKRGRRITAQFVQKPGDQIGDLAYVDDLQSVEDFRLGPTLLKLETGVAESSDDDTLPLVDADGQPLKDLAGRDVKADFQFPGATREIMIATIQDGQSEPVRLKEGESYTR